MLERLEELVLIETPSHSPEAQQPAFELLASWFRALDYQVTLWPGQTSGGCLLARPARRNRGPGYQLLVGHCDTVWPVSSLATMPFRVEGDRAFGPGVFDMKCGLVMMATALEILRDFNLKPQLEPVVLINSDEEIGSRESTALIRRWSRWARRAFILEPALGPRGRIKTARKGVGGFEFQVAGVASHAGLEPEKGASAILEMCGVIEALSALNDPERGITVNIGRIEGGQRPNVVPPQCSALVDVRVLTERDARKIEGHLRSLKPRDPRFRLTVKGGFGRPPLEPTLANQELWNQAYALGRQLGLELEQATAGGGSDGNTTSQYTATLDGLGAVGAHAHNPAEQIEVGPVLERTALLALLLIEAP